MKRGQRQVYQQMVLKHALCYGRCHALRLTSAMQCAHIGALWGGCKAAPAATETEAPDPTSDMTFIRCP